MNPISTPSTQPWTGFLERVGVPAYVSDANWDLRDSNDMFDEIFEAGHRPRNIMEWALLDPVAKTYLGDWAQVWAPPMAAQLRLAISQRPQDPQLGELGERVARDPLAGPIYQGVDPADPGLPDGACRPLWHAARQQYVVAAISVAELYTPPGARLVFVIVPRPAGSPPAGERRPFDV
ncbi:hypothetical protein [Kitasatospora sp. NPDC088783]|uniref:MmyB family transcriptional regulator n=1 Tax=Kitasatospora sp. NPDC088783 TaxID=3364077 RepID=UPI00381D6AF0